MDLITRHYIFSSQRLYTSLRARFIRLSSAVRFPRFISQTHSAPIVYTPLRKLTRYYVSSDEQIRVLYENGTKFDSFPPAENLTNCLCYLVTIYRYCAMISTH